MTLINAGARGQCSNRRRVSDKRRVSIKRQGFAIRVINAGGIYIMVFKIFE